VAATYPYVCVIWLCSSHQNQEHLLCIRNADPLKEHIEKHQCVFHIQIQENSSFFNFENRVKKPNLAFDKRKTKSSYIFNVGATFPSTKFE
jgi:hypothetical protein